MPARVDAGHRRPEISQIDLSGLRFSGHLRWVD
jgi:hypothetical protein